MGFGGFPYQFPPAPPVEVVPNVYFMQAGAGSLLILYKDGNSAILCEAPSSGAHSQLLLDHVQELAPGTTVTHVVQSHHHVDHAAGVREMVANGITLVVGHGIGDFWADRVLIAPSEVLPDTLSTMDPAPQVDIVEVEEAGSLVLVDSDDGTAATNRTGVTVTVYHHEVEHAADTVLTVAETADAAVVYVADLYNEAFAVTVGGPPQFFAFLRSVGLIDEMCESDKELFIAPSHGTPQALLAVIQEVLISGTDVGCGTQAGFSRLNLESQRLGEHFNHSSPLTQNHCIVLSSPNMPTIISPVYYRNALWQRYVSAKRRRVAAYKSRNTIRWLVFSNYSNQRRRIRQARIRQAVISSLGPSLLTAVGVSLMSRGP